MQNRMKLTSVLMLGLMVPLSGCLGGTAVTAAGSALAGSAATGAMTSGSNIARFQNQSCEELAAEIANAQRAMINPMTIPSTQAYIRDARQVASEKGCPTA